MYCKTVVYKELSVIVRLSIFEGNGAGEYHAVVENSDNRLDAASQYRHTAQALSAVQGALPADAVLVLKRYLVSDAVNHASLVPEEGNVAVSVVQQPPLNGSKVSVWAYWICDAVVRPNGENGVIAERPAYRHLFNTQLHSRAEGEFAQTKAIFETYGNLLAGCRLSLKDNGVRTWIYVQDVDTRYAGMVEARRLYFHEQGLTEGTHYLASTGIEGKYPYPGRVVFADAYAVDGIVPEQVAYLHGASHLNAAHRYGATFERAVAVDYGDRRHIFVSGTASIDNRGEIVFPFNIGKQLERTLENIGVLLAEGGCDMGDVGQLIVYLRDTGDYRLVSERLSAQYPDIPTAIVWAPVCRPGWLVEIECIAVKAGGNGRFAAF